MANKTEVRSLSASLRSSDDGKFEIMASQRRTTCSAATLVAIPGG